MCFAPRWLLPVPQLHDVDDEVSKARHVIRVMVAKMNRNKYTVGGIVFLLFAAIGLVIYLKLHL